MKMTPSTNILVETSALEAVATVIRAYTHPLRIRILDYLLVSNRPCHVTEMVQMTEGASQAIVSQQLRLLRESGIVKTERRGNFVYYSLSNLHDRELLLCIRRYVQERREADEAQESATRS
jgi:DNA-binding transcriptional ArsR family regulator